LFVNWIAFAVDDRYVGQVDARVGLNREGLISPSRSGISVCAVRKATESKEAKMRTANGDRENIGSSELRTGHNSVDEWGRVVSSRYRR
jgi:hypothetical protein